MSKSVIKNKTPLRCWVAESIKAKLIADAVASDLNISQVVWRIFNKHYKESK